MYTVNIRFRVSAYNLTATVVHEHSTVGFLEHFITEVGPEIKAAFVTSEEINVLCSDKINLQ